MAHDTIHGKNLYLRVTEPLYFVNTLVMNAERSRSIGFNVKVMMGGPEKFPTHTFEGAGIKKNKLLLFTDAIAYWTRMVIDVTGKSESENEAETERMLEGLEGEVETH
ncbi:MAG TPA: hypothetical protein P5511_01245 [Candidatus Goldiibacteriota bacterium]|nr:hypothetical protein [Candidatus Goldiibacteriota bacterium]